MKSLSGSCLEHISCLSCAPLQSVYLLLLFLHAVWLINSCPRVFCWPCVCARRAGWSAPNAKLSCQPPSTWPSSSTRTPSSTLCDRKPPGNAPTLVSDLASTNEAARNILFCGYFFFCRSMGCSMDSLVFVSSWKNPIGQAKLQVKVKKTATRIGTRRV